MKGEGAPILEASRMTIEFATGNGYVRAVDGASMNLFPGELVAIVGESGSGKSILLQSMLGVTRGRPGVVAGEVIMRPRRGGEVRLFDGIEQAITRVMKPDGSTRSITVKRGWAPLLEKRARAVRGNLIGLALQNGRAALDPFWKVGKQIESALTEKHGRISAKARRESMALWLRRLGFTDPERVGNSYPHELSGGMAQRAMLAVVLAREPEILFLDEITTGLDVSLQAAVLEQVAQLHKELGFSAVLVTHDLGIAQSLSSRMYVMKKGRVVQSGGTRELFSRSVPLDPYTERLFASVERPSPRKTIPVRAINGHAPRVEATGVSKHFSQRRSLFGGTKQSIAALNNVSLSVDRGECVALVGESGSGKTTLSRILVGLALADQGSVRHDGAEVTAIHDEQLETFRKRRVILFQNPYTSLNPAMTAEGTIAEALQLYKSLAPEAAKTQAREALAQLGLSPIGRRPLRALSGGERRRVGLLRAIQSNADFIVLDEPTAGLDALHRIQVAEIIKKLRLEASNPAIVIVSHDLGFVTSVADRVAVLYRGAVVEECSVASLLDGQQPHHDYTRGLLDASQFVMGEHAPEVVGGRSMDEELLSARISWR